MNQIAQQTNAVFRAIPSHTGHSVPGIRANEIVVIVDIVTITSELCGQNAFGRVVCRRLRHFSTAISIGRIQVESIDFFSPDSIAAAHSFRLFLIAQLNKALKIALSLSRTGRRQIQRISVSVVAWVIFDWFGQEVQRLFRFGLTFLGLCIKQFT